MTLNMKDIAMYAYIVDKDCSRTHFQATPEVASASSTVPSAQADSVS